MNENLLKLLDILMEDQEVLERFSNQDSIDELYKFSTSIVAGYSLEEFKEFLKTLAENNQDTQATEKISDENLDGVAGGLGMPAKMASALMGGLFLLGSTGISANAVSKNNAPGSNRNAHSITQNINNNKTFKQRNNLKKITNVAQRFTNTNNNIAHETKNKNRIVRRTKINGKNAKISSEKWNEAESGIGYSVYFDFDAGNNTKREDHLKMRFGTVDALEKLLNEIKIENIEKDKGDSKYALAVLRTEREKTRPKDGKISFYMTVDMDLNTIEFGTKRGVISVIELKDNLSKNAQRDIVNKLLNHNF